MNKTALILLGGLLVLLPAKVVRAQEKPGELGIGVYMGIPFGFSAKYLLDRRIAVDTALGVQGGDFDVHMDLLTHFRDLSRQPPVGKLAPYVGLGMKIRDEEDTLFGFRFVGGLAYLIKDTPLEVFAEIAPVLRVAPSADSEFDGGAGLRYYFGSGSRRK
ncbi:MAG TPA: hypothetical protein DEB40_09785 [Elusimicrobia bacterium]|nr:hypothetical protein [Elusimicrobiota bacterium]HBT62020.1 hypothetical protein [Elusimicrobiota bacterium]